MDRRSFADQFSFISWGRHASRLTCRLSCRHRCGLRHNFHLSSTSFVVFLIYPFNFYRGGLILHPQIISTTLYTFHSNRPSSIATPTTIMAEEALDEWRVRANDIMNVTLVTKAEQGPPKTISIFHPTWTYPIVDGPDTIREHSETIYGYKGLKINLRFNASDMRPHLSHTSSKRVPETVAIEEPPEINELFEPFLPPGKPSSHCA